MTKRQKIANVFSELMPHAEWASITHIIISDFNLEDDWIDDAIERVGRWLRDDIPDSELNDYDKQCSLLDKYAILGVLHYLKTYPYEDDITEFTYDSPN